MGDTWILYKTTNLVNGKIYIGVHKLANTLRSKKYLGSGDRIKAAVKKYGRENFTRETLAEFSCVEDAYLAETNAVNKEFVERLDTYNIHLGGGGSDGTANKGRKHTEEAKTKIGAASKGNQYRVGVKTYFSEEHRAKIGASKVGNKNMLGKTHSPETLAKMSASQSGKIISQEHRNKMRIDNGTSIVINGKYYPSFGFASTFEKVSAPTVATRVRSENLKWSEWRYATPEEKAAHSLEASRQST